MRIGAWPLPATGPDRVSPAAGCTARGSVAMLVPGLEAKELERGVVASPGTLRELQAAVVLVRKVKYHKARALAPRGPPTAAVAAALPLLTQGAQDPVKTGSKFHVTAGHTTTMATATFFGNPILPVCDRPSPHSTGTRLTCAPGRGRRSGNSRSRGQAALRRERTTPMHDPPGAPQRRSPAPHPLLPGPQGSLGPQGLRARPWRYTHP